MRSTIILPALTALALLPSLECRADRFQVTITVQKIELASGPNKFGAPRTVLNERLNLTFPKNVGNRKTFAFNVGQARHKYEIDIHSYNVGDGDNFLIRIRQLGNAELLPFANPRGAFKNVVVEMSFSGRRGRFTFGDYGGWDLLAGEFYRFQVRVAQP